ncbi:MAG: hypothetical protein GX446_01895 [Chthonomonadales bacterium]|nr:hypothetical protein [Chthonomonadales bacterium]
MTAFRTSLWALALVGAMAQCAAGRADTLYTTHFFDWYRVTPEQPYEAMQRVFTFRPDWEGIGLSPEEVGVSQRYYSVQFRMIQKAGFDGIHYEWFGPQPSEECLRAIAETGMRVAMFYDQEIRFSGRPLYIKPTDAFRAEIVQDIASFYRRIPREYWLRESDGSLPLIFYAYQFDQSYRDLDAWDMFYRALLADLRDRLGEPVRIYWTDSGALCQTYAFQHFPEISSYSFGWWGGQRQIGARSVTFALHYDDLGAAVGGRAARTVNFDPRFMEEHLRLARWTRPRLVFNYGWNEFFEGENILPDRTWGDWRLHMMADIVRQLRAAPPQPLPSAILLLDDLYARDLQKPGSSEAIHTLVGAYRYLFPQAEARLGTTLPEDAAAGSTVVALTRDRSDADERALIEAANRRGMRVVFFEGDSERTGPLVSRFAAGPRAKPLENDPPPPRNQYVHATVNVDIDPDRYPFLNIRVRNSLNTFYHVRVRGTDDEGNEHTNHDNNSPLDWKVTGGEWEARRENVKAVLEAYAGRPILRITGLWLILNAVSAPGDFAADFASAEFTNEKGDERIAVPLTGAAPIAYGASFAASTREGWPQGGMTLAEEDGGTLRLWLKARFAEGLALDQTSQVFTRQPGVEVLAWATWPPKTAQSREAHRERVPLVMRRDNLFWVNTFAPHMLVYTPLMKALGMPQTRAAEHVVYQVVKGVAAEQRSTTPTILGRDELPGTRVRLYHPSGLSSSAAYPWPTTSVPLAAVRLRDHSEKAEPITVLLNGSVCSPQGQVTLLPGDIVDVYRVPVRITSAREVRVTATRESEARFQIRLTGAGAAEVRPNRSGVRVMRNGKPLSGSVRLPISATVEIGQPATNPPSP